AFAVRATRDAFQTRHGLSRHPCRSPGEVVHLSTVFDAENLFTLHLRGLSVIKSPQKWALCVQ
ncbi:hypothetical protein F7102_10115, partial [Dickeya dianthicola]|nr:hypothetical protein [Dickeya dianthicola]